ncbi:MAG TPA: SAM-dependent methyltransferase [Thermomicrobiales bacterium]|nr:SAM-dependent methyltransferase [Thermomicrobiales bacterium]
MTQFPAAPAGDAATIAAIRNEIERQGGRITFARFMDLALYHPEFGYYLRPERRPGRGGDFLTAPETHPFFGVALARQIADCWELLGRPAPFTIREYGAGVGGLAYDILVGLSRETPAVLPAVRYRLIEPNAHQRAQALTALTEIGFGHIVEAETPAAAADAAPIVGVALANEAADALPVHRLVWRDAALGFVECYVAYEHGGFVEVEGPLSPEAAAFAPVARLRAAGVILGDGDRVEIGPAAAAWFGSVARGLDRGYAIVIDYGYDTAELYRDHRLAGTLRAYRAHTVTDDPFAAVGASDLTAHVDFGALRAAGEANGLAFAGLTTQGALLASLGLGDLLVELGHDPETTAPEYMAAQAAIVRLVDPGGMGRFRVLLMAKNAPAAPLRGLSERGPKF